MLEIYDVDVVPSDNSRRKQKNYWPVMLAVNREDDTVRLVIGDTKQLTARVRLSALIAALQGESANEVVEEDNAEAS